MQVLWSDAELFSRGSFPLHGEGAIDPRGITLRRDGGDFFSNHPAQPEQVGPCFVLTSEESPYMSVEVLHPESGEVVNG
jgi:hypothetical protein